MNLEAKLKNVQAALKQVDWLSTEEHIDYDLDNSSGALFLNGRIAFLNNTILEFIESITPERHRYRYQYMQQDGSLIFRYDNVPHHRQLVTFPHHKHYPDQVVESNPVDLKQVIEEIIEIFATSSLLENE
jgi:hypothetical protein